MGEPGRAPRYQKLAPGEPRPKAPELQFLDQQSQSHPVCPERPARVQVTQIRKMQQAEHLGEYNIWYGKYSGERSFDKNGKASTRCSIELDAGLTRADYTNPGAPLCVHFVRGACVNGKDCTYRHCAPTEQDETNTDAPHDVFGRNRHGTFRDDMGGVGSWHKECKTIYIGQICATPPEPQMTETLARHFGEFGVLESVRLLKAQGLTLTLTWLTLNLTFHPNPNPNPNPNQVRVLKLKGCGFVTYKLRSAAEFAKEVAAAAPAAPCAGGCNPMRGRLQPYAREAATLMSYMCARRWPTSLSTTTSSSTCDGRTRTRTRAPRRPSCATTPCRCLPPWQLRGTLTPSTRRTTMRAQPHGSGGCSPMCSGGCSPR